METFGAAFAGTAADISKDDDEKDGEEEQVGGVVDSTSRTTTQKTMTNSEKNSKRIPKIDPICLAPLMHLLPPLTRRRTPHPPPLTLAPHLPSTGTTPRASLSSVVHPTASRQALNIRTQADVLCHHRSLYNIIQKYLACVLYFKTKNDSELYVPFLLMGSFSGPVFLLPL